MRLRLSVVPLVALFMACPGPDQMDGGTAGGSAGGRAGGSATAGGSTAGGSTAGGATAGGATAGGATAGGATAGGATAGGATAGGATAGGATAGGATAGGATAGGATAGGATAGGATAGGATAGGATAGGATAGGATAGGATAGGSAGGAAGGSAGGAAGGSSGGGPMEPPPGVTFMGTNAFVVGSYRAIVNQLPDGGADMTSLQVGWTDATLTTFCPQPTFTVKLFVLGMNDAAGVQPGTFPIVQFGPPQTASAFQATFVPGMMTPQDLHVGTNGSVSLIAFDAVHASGTYDAGMTTQATGGTWTASGTFNVPVEVCP